MKVDKHSLAVLAPVIESAREVLADMEQDDIPVSLRKVAKSSARRLPPPFARSVLLELESNDLFRASVAQQYATLSGTDEDLVRFFADPNDAMARIIERGGTSHELDVQDRLQAAAEQIAGLERQLAEAKRRIGALRSEHARELGTARSSVSQGQLRAEARIENLTRAASAQQDEMATLGAEIVRLSDELSATERKLGAAIERGRRRDDNAGRTAQGTRVDATPSDPLELARWLDGVERRVRPFRVRGHTSMLPPGPEPFVIEAGVAPDSGAAVASLIEQWPRRFILDGYNIGGEIYGEGFSTRLARDDVIGRAGRLARGTDAEVVVVFDGPDEEGRSGFRSSSGVVVRFSRGDKADDVIAGLVTSDPERNVVVTNDRDLRDRCTIAGCVTIWATAFLEWS